MNAPFPTRLPPYLALLSLFLLVLAPLWLFGVIAEDVAEKEVILFDVPVLLWLHAHAQPWLDRLMLFFSVIGSAWVVVPVDVAVLVLLRRDRSKAAYWALATGGAALLNVCAKHGFQRVRPDLWPPLSPEQSFSFPSGHAMQTMAMFAALMVLRRATPGAWALALAGGAYVAAVGLSRAYLGVHFPSDVLAGWCASITWCVGLAAMMRSRLIHGGHLTVA